MENKYLTLSGLEYLISKINTSTSNHIKNSSRELSEEEYSLLEQNNEIDPNVIYYIEDGEAAEEQINNFITLASPNGTKFRLSVTNNGEIITTKIEN